MRHLWEVHRGYTTATLVLRLVRAVVPVAALWIGRMIVDAVVAASRGYGSSRHVLSLIAVEFALVITGELLVRASAIEAVLGELLTTRMNERLMAHAGALDLQTFEDAGFQDHLERARRGTENRAGLLTQTVAFAETGIGLLLLVASLMATTPWLALLLVVASLPNFLNEVRFADLTHSLRARLTQQRRELEYMRYVATSTETVKEVLIFGLAPWLIERFRRLSVSFHEYQRQLIWRRIRVASALALISTGASYIAVVTVVLRAVSGVISIGTFTFLVAAFQRARSGLQVMLVGVSQIYEQTLYVNDYVSFLNTQSRVRRPANGRCVAWPIKRGFTFENVGFRYSGTTRWAVRNLNFTVRPGERIALVGENGAGKTTVTKLLARLYDPSEGTICLDGIDLREYALDDLRRIIGVVFQDFVRFDLRFDENIGLGSIETMRAYLNADASKARHVEVPPEIRQAADESLASSILSRLPEGYHQVLGRRFESGVNLSGGEWQKIALARAYMRNAEIVILDEPTSALDARAEYDTFLRFERLMRGRMALLVSHRFSTVRMADRILVLADGRLAEEGDHGGLISHGGLYAGLFAMQAEGYR